MKVYFFWHFFPVIIPNNILFVMQLNGAIWMENIQGMAMQDN